MRDTRGYFRHFGFAESARGYGWAAQAHAAWVQRRIHIKRDAVLVNRDVGLVERRFSLFAAHAFGENIHQNKVRVGAAGNHAEPFRRQARGHRLRVKNHLLLIGHKLRGHGFQEADGLSGDDVDQRTTLHARKYSLIDGRAELLTG